MAAKAILSAANIEEDVGGPLALRVVDDAAPVTITFHGETGKVTRIKNQTGLRTVVCSTAHYYDPHDSFAWPAEVGSDGAITLVAESVDPKTRLITEEKWTVQLQGGRAVAFERQ